jgi:integrase
LPIRGKPYWERINPGLSLGYRRNKGNGSWSIRCADGKGNNWIDSFAPADDYEGISGALTFWEAQRRAVDLQRGGADDHGKLANVTEAIAAYRRDLIARGGDPANADRILFHLTPSLGVKLVASLNTRELRHWRDGLLAKGLAPASVTRLCKSLAAVLSLAAKHDTRVQNRSAWKDGLEALPDSTTTSRSVVLGDNTIPAIVTTAYAISPALGLLIELLATTGYRPSQAHRLTVGDVQKNRLLMPSSLKGKGKRRIERRATPIPESLALRLKQLGKGRAGDAPLLLKDDGEPWGKTDLRDPFREIAKRVGLDPDAATPYCLRHSWIASRLVRGLPIKLIADAADTSPQMIQMTYGRYIPADHTDEVLRSALLDLSVPPDAPKVVKLLR